MTLIQIGLVLLGLSSFVFSHRGANSPIPTDSSSKVVVLTDENFRDVINSNDEWILEFYANWCGACRNYAPQYDTFSKKVVDELPHIKVAKVDVDANPMLTSRFFIS
ncbi:Protein disulfide-isomerase A4, partial [Nowakowskiella sp. JEL0078]